MEKSNIISVLLERVKNLEEWRAEKKKTTGKKAAKVDEEVCPECGGDLLFVEEGIVHCPKCDQYYAHEGEVEE